MFLGFFFFLTLSRSDFYCESLAESEARAFLLRFNLYLIDAVIRTESERIATRRILLNAIFMLIVRRCFVHPVVVVVVVAAVAMQLVYLSDASYMIHPFYVFSYGFSAFSTLIVCR